MTAPDTVVVVGTSVGGVRTAQALRADGFQGRLVVVGEEDVPPYDKPPLSKQLLTGEWSADDISLLGPDGWSGVDVEARLGVPACGLDAAGKAVLLRDGERIGYDALVIATGARPRTLPATDGPVHTVRELRDATEIRERFLGGGPVVVVGSGFIGAEVASTARQAGLETTVLEVTPTAFSGVLGDAVGSRIQQMHQRAGVQVRTGAAVSRVEALADGTGLVHLADGARLEAACVVVGVGVVPNTEWLRESPVPLLDGVVTDEHCRVEGLEGVYAVGDLARWYDRRTGQHRRVEHWTNAVEQASLVAHNLLHPEDLQAHLRAPYFWTDQHGTKIQMVGRIGTGDRVELLACETTSGERVVALYADGERMSAAVAFGWPRAIVACRGAWEREADVADVRVKIEALASRVRVLAT